MEGEAHRILFAGGGTGGHLYPALTVAAALGRRLPSARIGFIGARRGLEQRLVPAAGYELRSLALSGAKGRRLVGRVGAFGAAAWAVARCLGWMVRTRPDLVIGVGGYASGPAVLAAILLRVRTMVLEQNHLPGATNRWLAPRVDAVCLPSETARRHLGGRGIVTGNPVRAEFFDAPEPVPHEVLRVLVFGGSRGARSINEAMIRSLDRLAASPVPPFLVHQTGGDDLERAREAYRDYPADRQEVHAFLDDMASRLAWADLVVCRAGASTLGELAAAGRPAVLIPYPFAADDHQRHNAETLSEAGAARVLLDRELPGESLGAAILELGGDPRGRLGMARAARGFAQPDAAERIVDVVETLIGGGAGRENGGRSDVP